MTERNPLPDCLSHLGQMWSKKERDLLWNVAIEQAAPVVDAAIWAGRGQLSGTAFQIRRMKRPIND